MGPRPRAGVTSGRMVDVDVASKLMIMHRLSVQKMHCFCILLLCVAVFAIDNGKGLTPPMGWYE